MHGRSAGCRSGSKRNARHRLSEATCAPCLRSPPTRPAAGALSCCSCSRAVATAAVVRHASETQTAKAPANTLTPASNRAIAPCSAAAYTTAHAIIMQAPLAAFADLLYFQSCSSGTWHMLTHRPASCYQLAPPPHQPMPSQTKLDATSR